jgi:hypothetical protein
LYRQSSRLILHVVNLTSAGTWRQPVHEFSPVGPLRVRVKTPPGLRGKEARLLVSGQKSRVTAHGGWSRFQITSVLDHEVVVLS